ncbi:MAG TPA: hypothetical protein VF074_15550 [Pyrinomonadaceae bacterium]
MRHIVPVMSLTFLERSNLFFLTAVITFCLSLGTSAETAQSEEKLVRQTFVDYKSAILQRQGQTAVTLVNQATLDYYARMQGLALEGQEREVRQLTPLNKILVLSLRHRVAIDQLRMMTPNQVFTYAVSQGWIGKNSVLDSEIGGLRILGNDASAEYLKGGQRTSLNYRFTKENGRWKIDLTALTPFADQAMKMLIAKEGLDEDTFVVSLIESVSGKRVLPSIWHPPGK